MKTAALIAALALATTFAGTTLQDEGGPTPTRPTAEHKWLQQLAGNWTTEAQYNTGPGQPTMTAKGTSRIETVGGLWTVAHGETEIMGDTFTAVMTLGYMSSKKKFVGTWIDSMMDYLWHYEGSLDAEKKVLTLLTSGPSHTDPTKTGQFRERIVIASKDEWAHHAELQQDGQWVEMGKTTFRRKK